MMLRDLNDKQRLALTHACDRWYKERNKGRVLSKPYDEASFMAGFSDGVRTVLEKLDKLP